MEEYGIPGSTEIWELLAELWSGQRMDPSCRSSSKLTDPVRYLFRPQEKRAKTLPVLRIPTLAIHLERSDTFTPNKETHLSPIAGLVAAELKRQDEQSLENNQASNFSESGAFTPLKTMTQRHHSQLVELIAAECGAKPSDVLDFELLLYDTQKACLGGLHNEFIFSARLDNLNQTFCTVEGLINSLSSPTSLDSETSIRLIACFDHEEIGSMTAQGAHSSMLPAIIRRLSVLPASTSPSSHESESDSWKSYDKTTGDSDMSTAYEQTLSCSFLISADMAHSVHPNYAAKYEPEHKTSMSGGPVIKINANARYATNSPGIALLQEIARTAPKLHDSDTEGVPLQLFVVRNDSSCGSTIGPVLSAALGARTLDIGNPQLSMHSIRECGGVEDIHHAIRLFSGFFQKYSELERKILVD